MERVIASPVWAIPKSNHSLSYVTAEEFSYKLFVHRVTYISCCPFVSHFPIDYYPWIRVRFSGWCSDSFRGISFVTHYIWYFFLKLSTHSYTYIFELCFLHVWLNCGILKILFSFFTLFESHITVYSKYTSFNLFPWYLWLSFGYPFSFIILLKLHKEELLCF